MVYLRKRLPKAIVNDCNERIVHHDVKVIRASNSHDPDDDSGRSASTGDQPITSAQKQPNQGSLLIDATCVPVDIRHPTDLSLLNVDEVFSKGVAMEATEILIDAMWSVSRSVDRPFSIPQAAEASVIASRASTSRTSGRLFAAMLVVL